MFTQCPQCSSVYRVTAENLREAMGYVRCPGCRAVFNALAVPQGSSSAGRAQEIGSQLSFIHAGDRAVVDRSYLEQTGVFSSLKQLRERERVPGFDQTQALRLGEYTTVSLPDTPGRAGAGPAERHALPAGETVDAPGGRRLLAAFASLALASRNLLRHRKRTLFALSAIGFGVVALTLAGGFMEWMQWAERESTIHSRLGHIQLVREGYFERGAADPYGHLLAQGAVDVERLRALPHVAVVTPRLSFSGLISRGETTLSFLGKGVHPVLEGRVAQEVKLRAGEELSPSAPDGIVLGKGLAESLGAAPGDTVVLLTTLAGGGVSAVEARVRGIFQTAMKAYDDVYLRVPIELARELMRVRGTHSWVVLLDDTAHTDRVVADLRAGAAGPVAGMEVVPWLDLADFYKKVVELFSAQMGFVRGIIGVIILMSISNTLVMSVMERTAEIGTLMAVGFRRQRVMGLFVREGVLLGLVGGLAGALVGYGLAEAISAVGIPMPPAPGMDMPFTAEIRVTPGILAASVAVAVVATVLASLYPAWKASRLNIVDALRRAR